jgi:hypothetical protein
VQVRVCRWGKIVEFERHATIPLTFREIPYGATPSIPVRKPQCLKLSYTTALTFAMTNYQCVS